MAKILRANTNKKGIYITVAGLALAREELELLKTKKRQEISERIQTAREQGDLSENSEYDAALEEQALVESRIAELETSLNGIKVISQVMPSDSVVIGSTVKVKVDGETIEYTIVGRLEADPMKKRISNESPLGSALLGSKKGEEVEISTADLRYTCKIIDIK